MTPQELEDALVDYLYDELDASERARFEAALPEAPEIAAEVAAHRRTREAMGAMEDVPVPAGLLDGILEEAERRADARTESEPSFWEKLLAGLLQPAALTLGLFFVVGTTGYFMVESEGNPQVADTSVAVKAAPPASTSKPGEIEADEVPELEEESDQSLDNEEGASESNKVAEEESSSDPKAQDGELSKQLLVNDEPEKSRVSAGTVARLVNLESDAGDDAPASLAELSGSMKPRGKVVEGLSDSKRSKRTSKRKSKAYAPQAKMAGRRRMAEPNNAYDNPGMGSRGKSASVQSARRGLKEIARERESINVGQERVQGRAQRDSVAQVPASKKRMEMLRQEPAQVDRASSASAPAPVAVQAESASRAEAPKRAETKEAELSPWQQVERKAAGEKSDRSRAGVWLGAYERFMKRGRHDLAGRALDRLSKVPGYSKQAKEKRLGLKKSKAAAQSKKKMKRSPTKSKGRK